MKKIICKVLKNAIEKTIIKSANTTSSYLAHQLTAPKGIEKFKKK